MPKDVTRVSAKPEGRKASKSERERVYRWLKKWQARLFMHIVRIETLFWEQPSNDDDANGASECYADIEPALADSYHLVRINFYPSFFRGSHEAQEERIVHELVHAITCRYTELVDRQRDGGLVTHEEQRRVDESVTDWIAKALFYDGSRAGTVKPMSKSSAKAALS